MSAYNRTGIECEYCHSTTSWCLYYQDGWVCKECFLGEMFGDVSDWWKFNEEAKVKRRLKRMKEFDDNHVNI